MKNIRSVLLVTVQLALIFLILITGPFIPKNIFLFILMLSGVVLGIWGAVIIYSKSRFSAFPEVREDANLVREGPYRFIRNPMYSGIIIALMALILAKPNVIRMILFLSEIAVLLTKISIEEKFLTIKFKEYKEYLKSTKKLIPFLY